MVRDISPHIFFNPVVAVSIILAYEVIGLFHTNSFQGNREGGVLEGDSWTSHSESNFTFSLMTIAMSYSLKAKLYFRCYAWIGLAVEPH